MAVRCPHAFGSPGAGRSLGFADPDAGIGYAYVTSQMGTSLTAVHCDVGLRRRAHVRAGATAAVAFGISSAA